MTLYEIVFMKSLILSKHRSRSFWFILNLLGMLIFGFIFGFFIDDNRPLSIIFVVLAGVLTLIFIVYFTEEKNPWTTKNNQLTALKENSVAHFEEIKSDPRLQEYFEI